MNRQIPFRLKKEKFKKNKLCILAILLSFFLAPFELQAQYCPPTVVNAAGYNAGVAWLRLGSINKQTSVSDWANPYYDFTSEDSAVVSMCDKIGYSLTAGNSNNSTFAIFVDWNNDGTWDNTAPERINVSAASMPPNSILSGSFTVPVGTPAGTYRVRVAGTLGGYAIAPCNLPYTGNVIDVLLVVKEPVGTDIKMVEIIPPAKYEPTGNTIQAVVQNVGITSISNAVIGYQLQGSAPVVQPVDFSVTSDLQSCETRTVTYSATINLPPAAGILPLKTWANKPNGVQPDANINNDTFITAASLPLSGNYTINPSGSGLYNFVSFNAAASSLMSFGIEGPVVFQVASGTYQERLVLGVIPGSSATNTITFTGGAGNASSRVLQYDGSSFGTHHTLLLQGASNIRFDNLTIRGLNANMGWAVQLMSNCQNVKFKNNIIEVGQGAANTNQIAFVISNSTTSPTTGISNVKDIEIDSNSIRGGYYGLYIYGSGYASGFNFKIRKNNILGFHYYGAYVYYVNDAFVTDNVLEPRVGALAYNVPLYVNNIQASSGYVVEIARNDIKRFGQYGIFLSSVTNVGGRMNVVNNSVVSNTVYAQQYAIYVGSCPSVNFWHNSVNLTEPNTTSPSSAAFFTSSNGADIRNNVLSVSAIGSVATAFLAQSSSLEKLDYNNFYKAGIGETAELINVNTAPISRLALVGGQGFNQNSVSREPLFANPSNLRLSGLALSPLGTSVGITNDIDSRERCSLFPSMGASESPFVSLLNPQVIVKDTLFVNSPADIRNSAFAGEPKIHEWTTSDGGVYNTIHINHTFTQTGLYSVQLKTTSCVGTDSVSKNIRVVVPGTPPVAAFGVDFNEADQGYPVNFKDLSTGGASSWNWSTFPEAGVEFLPSKNVPNPQVVFTRTGTYNICLRVSNAAGQSELLCKDEYITVIESNNLCSKTRSSTVSGKLFDDGGKNGLYGNGKNCSFLIDPCASEVTLSFSRFAMESGDFLRVYDGVDANGIPLHTGAGFTGSALPGSVTASTGKMFVQFITNVAGNSIGFEAKWTSVPRQFNEPVASFSAPEKLYTGTSYTFISNSSGIDPVLGWDFNNDGTFEANTPEAEHTFENPGTYLVRLNVSDCGGVDNAVKTIKVENASGVPSPEFSSNLTSISQGQSVKFYDRSSQGPTSWTWTVTPNTVTFVNGTDENSQNPEIRFNALGNYNIRLEASNSFGSGTPAVKNAYIRVVEYCFPGAGLNENIGITRVTFAGIDNISYIGPATYTDYTSSVGAASIQKGGVHEIRLERTSSAESMSRKVWIDLDGNGVFSADELLAEGAPDTSIVWTYNVNIPATAREGSTRMRVGTGYSGTKNEACGVNPYGEFEDYSVRIFNNLVRPVITIVGSENVVLELGSSYSDSGATAMDDVEGDITSRIITTNDLDINTVGEYTYRYNVSDQDGNSTEAIRYISIIPDRTAPVVTLVGANPMSIPAGVTFVDPGATAEDNIDGDITSKIIVTGGPVLTNTPGQYVLKYSATDENGNTGFAERLIFVGDTTRPEIVLKGAATITIEVGTSFSDPGAIVMDNVNQNLSYEVDLSVVNPAVVGSYTLEYTAKDVAGNEANPVYRTVIVEDFVAPVLSLIGDTVVIEVKSDFVEPGYFVNDNYYSGDDLTVNITGSVNNNFVSVYFLMYQAVDGSGNKSDVKVRVVKVVDTERPVIVLNGDRFQTICRWSDYTDPGAIVTDNYDTDIELIVIGKVESATEGAYSISYSAKDRSNNMAIPVERIVRVTGCNTSVKDVEGKASFNVYPNPSKGQFNVVLNTVTDVYTIEVRDMMGRIVNAEIVKNAVGGSATVNLYSAVSGVYFVTVVAENHVATKKIELIR